MTFTEEADSASNRHSDSYFGFMSVASIVSTTFARELPGLTRRRQRPSAGAHATAATEADGPAQALTQGNSAGEATGPRTRVMHSSSRHHPQNV